MEERAEGATRCRDVSRETFANRASSQVGSGARSTESEPEEEVGAGERGRLRPGEEKDVFDSVLADASGNC